MTLCACVISGVRVEDINIRRENVWHIVNKASVQAPTIAGLIQLACLASHDSLHLRTHLQLSASVLLAAVPLNMWRDRICLLTHDVQAIVIIDLPFSYPTKDTPLICIFLCNQKTLMRTGAVWAPATVLWPSAFYRPWLGVASTPLFARWNHFIKNMSLKWATMKLHNT